MVVEVPHQVDRAGFRLAARIVTEDLSWLLRDEMLGLDKVEIEMAMGRTVLKLASLIAAASAQPAIGSVFRAAAERMLHELEHYPDYPELGDE